ncbi:MAG: transcriptional regulator, LysR family, partial [Solirubrobacterales bacterium]|nr:transcriptional regulator, LysR family [Solirubrobacterales bacterium]
AALVAFHAAHPRLQLVLRQGSAAEVLGLLTQGAVDVAITSLPAPAGTRTTPLGAEALVIAAAAGTPLAGGIAALREHPLILAERGTTLRRIVVEACQAEGFSPVPLLEVSDPAAILTLVRAGLGRCVVPASWVAGKDGLALAVTPLRLSTTLLCGAATLSPAAALLHAHLREQLAR